MLYLALGLCAILGGGLTTVSVLSFRAFSSSRKDLRLALAKTEALSDSRRDSLSRSHAVEKHQDTIERLRSVIKQKETNLANCHLALAAAESQLSELRAKMVGLGDSRDTVRALNRTLDSLRRLSKMSRAPEADTGAPGGGDGEAALYEADTDPGIGSVQDPADRTGATERE